VTTERRGRWIDYSLAPDALERLHAAIPCPAVDAAVGAGVGASLPGARA
jgi:hypothetical protein